MKKTVREGDANNAGGIVTRGVSSFIIDNKKVSVDGSPVSNHPRRHVGKRTANGNKSFMIENKPVNTVGNADSCGHTRAQGSSSFIIG